LLDTVSYLLERWCVLDGMEHVRPTWELRIPTALVAIVSFALAGRWTSSQIAASAKPWWSTTIATLAAIHMPAALVGLLSLGYLWPLLMKAGAVASLVALPGTIMLALSAQRAWQARTASLLIAAYRRARFLDLSLFTIALGALYANPMFGAGWRVGVDRTRVAQAIVVAATVAGVVAALLALRSLGLLHKARRHCQQVVAVPIDDSGAAVVDVGVGEQLSASLLGRASAYRGRRQAAQLLRGDVDRARSTLVWALLRAGATVYAGMFVLWFDGGPYTLPWTSALCG
jgi:hypothetical protein